MRFLLTLFPFLISLSLPAQVKKPPVNLFSDTNKKVEINGHIKNYVPGNGNRFIRFRTYEITGRSNDTTSFIDVSGNFRATLPQPFECDLALMFDESYVTFYATPGEKINMEIDPAKLLSSEDKSKAFTITGRSAPVSKLIMQFHLTGQEFLSPEENWEDSILSDKAIAGARIKRMKKEIDSLEEWMKKRPANKTFANWARHKLMYQAGADIAFNLYTSKRRRSDDQQMVEYLRDISIENVKALNNSAYYQFMRTLAIDMQIIVNINPVYDSLRKLMGKNAMPLYLDKIDKYSKGFAKQLLYYHTLISNTTEKTGPCTERFDSVIKTPYLQRLVVDQKNRTPFQPFSVIQRLKEYQVDDSLKSRLISIFENNKKNLFVDFWGSWCGPCMREMPHYPKMIDQFKNSELNFLFFAVETPEEKVTEIKNKYGIDATFITLTDNEARILNQVLQFSSYPSHFIIAPDGTVRERLNVGLLSGNEVSPLAFEKIKKYSSLWY